MKERKLYIIIILVSLNFPGCLRTYYPAIYYTGSYPMISETEDSLKSNSKYLGADLNITKAGYEQESLQLLKANYVVVDTKDYYNVNERIYGYAGNYKVAGLNGYNGNKSVFGLGAEFSACLTLKIYDLKLGLGFNIGGAAEFGSYYNFRKNAEKESIIDGDKRLFLPMFSTFPLISYKFSDSTILSTQANIGLPGLFSPSLVLNNKSYVYWLSWLPDPDNKLGSRLVLGFTMNLDSFNKL